RIGRSFATLRKPRTPAGFSSVIQWLTILPGLGRGPSAEIRCDKTSVVRGCRGRIPCEGGLSSQIQEPAANACMPTLDLLLDLLRPNRGLVFWTLHAAGWTAYGLTQYFGALLYEKPASFGHVILIATVAGFVLSMPMRFIYRRLWERSPREIAV